MKWENEYKSKLVALEKAATVVNSGDSVWMAPFLSTPQDLVLALCERYQELESVLLNSGMLMYPYPFMKEFETYNGHLNYRTMFTSAAETAFRDKIIQGSMSISDSFWYIENVVKPDVALLEVSAPDENGYMSLGPTGGMHGYQVKKSAKKVIVQVNSNLPYNYGDIGNFIHVSEIDYICEKDREVTEFNFPDPTPEEQAIAKLVANEIIDNGDCVQAGLGPLLNAIFEALEHHKDIGIHSEALMQGMVDMVEKGVITCAKKNYHPGKITYGFYAGKKSTYDFVNKNQFCEAYPIPYVNNSMIAARNDNYVSINGAMMLDLTGQINAESIGFDQVTGLGGHLDHVTASRFSKGGKAIITMTSTYPASDGSLTSRIVSAFPVGSSITSPRAFADYMVTEYGVAKLRDRSIPERVEAMISIAHPDFREQLEREAYEAGLLKPWISQCKL